MFLYRILCDYLRDYSEGNIWSDGDNILVKTEEAADAIADMLETIFRVKETRT